MVFVQSQDDKVMEPTPGPTRQGSSNAEGLASNMSELPASSDKKVTGYELIKRECFNVNMSKLRATFEKNVMEPTPGPSGLRCPAAKGSASNMNEFPASSDKKIMGCERSKLACFNVNVSELRATFEKNVMKPAPGPIGQGCPAAKVLDSKTSELPATSDNKVMEPASISSEQRCSSVEVTGNLEVGGDINVNVYKEVARHADLSSRSLIYGFPARIKDKDCLGRVRAINILLNLVETHQHVLVTGCGGIGKTTLAMKCAERWTTTKWFWKPTRFTKAAFLLMEDEEAAKRSFIGLAKQCKIPLDNDFLPQLRSFYDKLNKSKILLIFDNINDEIVIDDYLPDRRQHPNIFVLGTAYHGIPQLFHGYQLKELSERATVKLMMYILNSPTGIPESLLRKLARSLDCLALAVRHIASVICQDVEETRKDIVEAIETYIEESDTKFDKQLGPKFSNYYGKTVYASLRHNIDKCVNDSDLMAKRLLHIFSYLNPTHIKEDMLKHVPGVTEEVLSKLIYCFVRYSIVAGGNGYMRVHRTTQAVVRDAYAREKGDILPCVFHMLGTCDQWSRDSHLPYVLPEMSESMLTECYQSLFTLDSYKKQRDELEGYEEGLVLQWEPPQFAAYLGHSKVLDRLRELNSSDTWITKSGWSWIHAAVLGGQRSVLDEYMTDSSIRAKQISITHHTDLHLNMRTERELIRRGKNLNIRYLYGDSALYVALSRGALDTALELLRAGSEINPELCSEITATHSVIRKLSFPYINTGREHPVEVDIQYLYMATVGQVEEMRPGALFRFYKYVDSPHNTQMLKNIQDERGEEFRAVLEAVDEIWEFALLAFGYIRQHQLTVRRLIKEISREEEIPGVQVIYPPRAHCSKALAFTKLLLNKIKNTTPNDFSILVVLVALPYYYTVNDVSGYLNLNTRQVNTAIERLEGYRILYKQCLKNEMQALIRAFIIIEELPSDVYLSLFTSSLFINRGLDESLLRLALDQMSLNQLTVPYERDSHLDPCQRWVDVLKRLQKAGCKSIKSSTNVTWSALHYVVVFLDMYFCNFREHVIEKLLELGVEMNVKGPGAVTPLHVAASNDMSSETVRVLVKNGAQVNAVTVEGLTPMHMAASVHSKNIHGIVAVLLEAGGQVNATTPEGLTPLHMAVSSSYEVAKKNIAVLLKAGGQVNAMTSEGLTPLHMAASCGYKGANEMVSVLLKAGGQVNAVTSEGLTPLHMATSCSNKQACEIVAVLLEAGSQVNAVTPKGLTPLHVVAHTDSGRANEIIPVLLEAGGQVNAVTHEGLTPLHIVAHSDSWNAHEIIPVLLTAGGQVNAVTNKGLTPLHMTVFSDSLYTREKVTVLLEAGGQVNAVTHKGLTPLHMAASSHSQYTREIIIVLLEAGGQVNAVTSEDHTPLHMAVSSSNNQACEIVDVLLEAGGQVNAVTTKGLTPLHMAASCDYEGANEMVSVLLKAGGQVNAVTFKGFTPLHMAIYGDYIDARTIVAMLLEAGGNVNAVTSKGLTPLHMAVLNRYHSVIEIVGMLLTAGGEVNAVTRSGLTPLHMAIANGYNYAYDIVAVLLKAGGQVNGMAPNGFTPLHMNVSRTKNDPLFIEEQIRMLLKAGADPDIKDKQGRTPLDVATPRALNILKFLLKS